MAAKHFKLNYTGTPRVKTTVHPTKECLLDTVMGLLDTQALESITVDLVLRQSGVSKGSLYHHFEDFPDLLEHALVQRFSLGVDKSVEMLSRVVRTSQTRDEAMAGLYKATSKTTAAALAGNRFERTKLIGFSRDNPRLSKKLASEQWRLTSALEGLFVEMQTKGWMSKSFDPRAAAVLIQAYALGKIIDDIVDEKVDEQAWNELVNKIIDRVFSD
ncbi:TetR/AcrR family transcriptional regulator [Ottowia sp.]|uniref:TetR/AcrR family transcriptional regulator n=1 Tax=Ottowia sp. TaxID=1898956 RepID=UPI002CDC6ADC|nr:TetR/AcrR family transcriptional regulator [Ottowia sp.]HOB66099.1 TetR/AcrR family transcriptional regulator [Ottowia sp.]HPZ58489.1 TetR/AcrR family transcriptional regulator [Ottowia sp.]HQD48042.1 TetR/AcrR family transcriptional regulator [Ottowia sp.]